MWYFYIRVTGSFMVYGKYMAFKRHFTDTDIGTLFCSPLGSSG
jgi:hypothetical protein